MSKCELCGEPMPAGEEMFKFHGYSCACPKPPLPKKLYGVQEHLFIDRDYSENSRWFVCVEKVCKSEDEARSILKKWGAESKQLESKLAASEEARKKAEAERIELHQLLSAETTAKFEYKQRAEAAEQRIKESQEQKPLAFIRVREDGLPKLTWNELAPFSYAAVCVKNPEIALYVYPPIPPALEELQLRLDKTVEDYLTVVRENAELRRRVAEREKVKRLSETLSRILKEPNETMSNGKALAEVIRLAKKALAATAPAESKEE